MKLTTKKFAREILKELPNTRIIISEREKNINFISKYHFSKQDIESYIRNLTEKDFKEKVKNNNSKIDTDYLYIFSINMSLENEFGDLEFVPIYIKIGKLNKNNEIILIVSFHESE